MRIVASTIFTLFVALHGLVSAQGPCHVDGPPDRLGQQGYVGQHEYTFDYWSDAGTLNGEHHFQVGTKNLGRTPVTIDWPGPHYFRRGIGSQREAPGECNHDRNDLRKPSGIIRYGPNATFDGPIADFYAREGQESNSAEPIKFLVSWEADLGSRRYQAAFEVGFDPKPTLIHYSFTNKGQEVEVEWPGVLTDAVLVAAGRLNPTVVRSGRLVMRDRIEFDIARNAETIVTTTAPLSIYMPNIAGPDGLLYRDNHRALVLRPRSIGE